MTFPGDVEVDPPPPYDSVSQSAATHHTPTAPRPPGCTDPPQMDVVKAPDSPGEQMV